MYVRPDKPTDTGVPNWVPEPVRLYLDHIEGGLSIRALARHTGCHASTVLRRVRKTESRRDDPLVDAVLTDLGRMRRGQKAISKPHTKDPLDMLHSPIDDVTLKQEAGRALIALMQPGAVLAVMPDVTTAVVVRDGDDGVPQRLASIDRSIAEALALKDWISCTQTGKISRGYITAAGRSAVNRMMAARESRNAGFAESQAAFERPDDPFVLDISAAGAAGKSKPRGRRSAGAESPLRVLARRRDKDGNPYLSSTLVDAGERLRMDFELAQISQKVGLNWEGLMTGPGQGGRGNGGPERQIAARERLESALRRLGRELADVALMTCCQQQGMEKAECEMNMPARSGKFVLRIALNMLARHYAETGDDDQNLIY